MVATFQSTVNIWSAGGVVGELAFDGPMRAAPYNLYSAGVPNLVGNAFTAWQKMGSPATPTPEQYTQLQQDGKLAELPALANPPQADKGELKFPTFTLPRQSVALIIVQWE